MSGVNIPARFFTFGRDEPLLLGQVWLALRRPQAGDQFNARAVCGFCSEGGITI